MVTYEDELNLIKNQLQNVSLSLNYSFLPTKYGFPRFTAMQSSIHNQMYCGHEIHDHDN